MVMKAGKLEYIRTGSCLPGPSTYLFVCDCVPLTIWKTSRQIRVAKTEKQVLETMPDDIGIGTPTIRLTDGR